MDFIDQLKQFSYKVENMKDKINTEEATKTSLIMPFFQLLGYDIFNPSEFLPEYTADVGIKKGEKVDYAIILDGKPVILIEAKWCCENLNNHDSQLFRYFGTSEAKFAILTNGIIYKFYTDLDAANKMDERPFLEFNIMDIKDNVVLELKKFQKNNFDLETILNTASELKYSNMIKQFMNQQILSPTDNFIRYILGEVYQGIKTQNVIDKFREVIKKSLNQFVNELLSERLKSVIQPQQETEQVSPVSVSENEDDKELSKITTKEEELEAYFIVKSLLREIISPEKITHKDTETYFGILLDNNSRKWICRLQLLESQKYLIVPQEGKKNGVRHSISCIDDIYQYKTQLQDVLNKYLNK